MAGLESYFDWVEKYDLSSFRDFKSYDYIRELKIEEKLKLSSGFINLKSDFDRLCYTFEFYLKKSREDGIDFSETIKMCVTDLLKKVSHVVKAQEKG